MQVIWIWFSYYSSWKVNSLGQAYRIYLTTKMRKRHTVYIWWKCFGYALKMLLVLFFVQLSQKKKYFMTCEAFLGALHFSVLIKTFIMFKLYTQIIKCLRLDLLYTTHGLLLFYTTNKPFLYFDHKLFITWQIYLLFWKIF